MSTLVYPRPATTTTSTTHHVVAESDRRDKIPSETPRLRSNIGTAAPVKRMVTVQQVFNDEPEPVPLQGLLIIQSDSEDDDEDEAAAPAPAVATTSMLNGKHEYRSKDTTVSVPTTLETITEASGIMEDESTVESSSEHDEKTAMVDEEAPTTTHGWRISSVCQSSHVSLATANGQTTSVTTQKPFDPAASSTASLQSPHTPEDASQPTTIWSIDGHSTSSDQPQLRQRGSKEELPRTVKLSPSVSLCSSSVTGGGPESTPSSATSVISHQDLLLPSASHRPNSSVCSLNNNNNNNWDPPLIDATPGSAQQQPSLLDDVRRLVALHKSQLTPPPPPQVVLQQHKSSKLSIASFSLTHDKDAIKTYRRMASKTHDKDIQMAYAKYLMEIARLYYYHEQTTRERLLNEAAYWIEKLSKAGHPEALLIRGKWLLGARPGQDDYPPSYFRQNPQPTKAYKCFQAAAKAKCLDAYYELARFHKSRGDYNQAVSCYKAAADEKHTLACYKMAKILLRGQLAQKRDIHKGLEYLRTAADDDQNALDSAEPAYVLSCVYADDLGRIGVVASANPCKKDEALALKYLLKAARTGLPMAVHRMGQVHEQGLLGQPRDPSQAYLCFTRAAEDGHEGAMLDLSRLYARGIPGFLMPQHRIAFKWCQRAAAKGLAQAEYVLGTYYEDGIGTIPDYPRALEYFGKAASKRHAFAAAKLNLPVKPRREDKEDNASDDSKQGNMCIVI